MAARTPIPKKKFFTAAQANAMLPLVRRIVEDIAGMARELRDREERLRRLRPESERAIGEAHREELAQAEADYERGLERMAEYIKELHRLGVELKDPLAGLVDFPCLKDGREVYLCWRLGEPEVAWWHEVHAGFAGRQRLLAEARPQG